MAGFASDKATDLSVYGLDNPRMTLTMSLLPKPGEAPRPPVTVFFSKGTDGSWYARQAGKPTVVMLDSAYMKDLLTDALAWKKKCSSLSAGSTSRKCIWNASAPAAPLS